MPTQRRIPAIVIIFLIQITSAIIVSAHDPFEITTIGRTTPHSLEMAVSMPQATAAMLLTADGARTAFQAVNFDASRPLLEANARSLFNISSAGRILNPTLIAVSLGQENDVDVFLQYPAPETGQLIITASHIARLPDGYGNAINLTQKTPPAVLGFKLLTKDDAILEAYIAKISTQSSTTQSIATLPKSALDEFHRFLLLGIQHILKGADHLLFLAGLLIAARNIRAMLIVISCFTLGHSITLALAALDFVQFSSRVVEPLIAATIIFIGIENLFATGTPKWRWLLTAAFGLVHGFGFASVLKDLGLGAHGSSLMVPLFSFNLGVELGQIGVCAIMLPLIMWTLRRPRAGVLLCRYGSIGISILGAYWLIERTLLGG